MGGSCGVQSRLLLSVDRWPEALCSCQVGIVSGHQMGELLSCGVCIHRWGPGHYMYLSAILSVLGWLEDDLVLFVGSLCGTTGDPLGIGGLLSSGLGGGP